MSINEVKRQILNHLEDGQYKSNASLIQEIECDKDIYNDAKNKLLEEGLVIAGRGYSGTIRIKGETRVIKLANRIENVLLENAPDGESLSNARIKDLINLNENQDELYIQAKEFLIEEGKIGKGKGQGGSIFLKIAEPAPSEQDLMYGIHQTLKRWAERNISQDSEGNKINNDYIVVDTSRSGPRNTGVWSKPDFTICVLQRYLFHRTEIEIYTFELKSMGNIDVRCVYEALNQSPASNFSYTILQIENNNTPNVVPDNVLDVAKKHGIGIITFTKQNDLKTWRNVLPAQWKFVRPYDKELFLTNFLDADSQQRITDWISVDENS